jgi:hypothetical protein
MTRFYNIILKMKIAFLTSFIITTQAKADFITDPCLYGYRTALRDKYNYAEIKASKNGLK